MPAPITKTILTRAKGNPFYIEEFVRMRIEFRFPHIEAEINAFLGWISLRCGNLAKAQALLEEALTLVDGTQHYSVLSSVLNHLGTVYRTQGNWDRATQTVERALAICEELGDLPSVARSYNNLGALKSSKGN
jgi:uncharacterized protein HemY